MRWKKKPLSYKIFVLAAVILLLSGIAPRDWAKHKVINNDTAEYYSYLPATIIYHDLHFDFITELPEDFEGRIWVVEPEEEDFRVVKMTMGLSLLLLPFFLLAHLFALLTPFLANGYSPPYEAAVYLGNVFYAIVGLYFLRKLLLRHFTEKITTWTFIGIAFATNFFFYASLHEGLTHAMNFALITGFIYFTEKWHERPDWETSTWIGLLTGIIVLVRPSNLVVVLIFLLYRVYNTSTLNLKWKLYKTNFNKLLTITILSLLVVSPQLIYWKVITGDWFYFTYGNESFFWHDPEIIKGLFSFRKGWLLYTPLMGLTIIGMAFLWKEKRDYAILIPVFLVLNVYIIYSWWAWWYGGGFGSRPLVDYYGLFAIPLAVFLKKSFEKRLLIKRVVQGLVILFLLLNVWQSKQYKRGVLHYDGMTQQAYFRLFFAWDIPKNYNKFIDRPDYKAAIKNIDRTESYYSGKLKPREEKLFNFTRGVEPLKKQLLEMYDHPKGGFLPILKQVIMNKQEHKEAYQLVVEAAKDKIRNIIKSDSNWYGKIKKQAKEENKPVDSLLQEHVNYVFFVDYRKKQL